ncbi:hypothetical protein D3C87_124630 [compost metagenome]
MEKYTIVQRIGLLISLLSLSACLQVGTAEEKKEDLNNDDFNVEQPAPETPGAGGGGEPSTPPVVTPPITEEEYGFLINNGGVRTASQDLILDFKTPFISQYVSISQGSTCSASFQPLLAFTQNYVSTQKNQLVTLSVQYMDGDTRKSPCYSQQIIIDQAGPDILFKKYPMQAVEAGQNVELVFEVTDALSEVTEVTCKFQGVSKTCFKGSNSITIPNIADGDYAFTVEASDALGNRSGKTLNWSVTSRYKYMSQKAQVKQNDRVDILFVIDNSGSMAYEQKSMGSRVSNFLTVLRGLNYQIAVTTTDPRSSVNYGDGQLVPMKGLSNKYILDSTMDENQTKTVLSNTLQRTETGSGTEQGIYAATRVVERALENRNSIYGSFFRDESQFAVVVISDEDESANGAKNDPNFLLNLLRVNFNGNKALSFHSIIARPNDKACLGDEGYSAGHRYAAFSNLTGGVIGDVCASDYAAQVSGIAEGVRKTLKTITLSCAPVVDAGHQVVVLKDGVEYTASRVVNGVNLVFDDMLPTGNYEMLFACLK